MGGHALKNVATQRLSRADFDRVAHHVVAVLRASFPQAQVQVIPAYGEKADFGDLDVLVSSEGLQADGGGDALKALVTTAFHARELVKNGNVLSFDHRDTTDQTVGFQVDVITMPDAEYAFALNYFSFNDLGNLIGRTAHKAGLSFGHDGLWYPLRDGDYLFRHVLVTRDFDAALSFLGYDPVRFHQGFARLDEVFAYVGGSAYFNRDIFLLENRSYKARVRDRKRKTYMEFLDWAEDRPDLPAYVYPEDRSEWVPRVRAAFPTFSEALDQALIDLSAQRRTKMRFNGERVSAWTGTTGKGLGVVMQHVRAGFESPNAFTAFLDSHDDEALKAHVLKVASGLTAEIAAVERPSSVERHA